MAHEMRVHPQTPESTESNRRNSGNLTPIEFLSAMPLLDFSPNDYRRLNQAAMQRFRDVYPIPEKAIVLFTHDGRLLITVAKPSQVDDLMGDAQWLKSRAYLVFGAIEVSIWFAGIEVWREPTESGIRLEKSTLSEKVMPTAILERPATALETPPIPPIEVPKFMSIDDIAAQMAVGLRMSIADARAELLKNQPVLFISSTAATEMIDKQIEHLQAVKAQLLRIPGEERTVDAPTNGNGSQAKRSLQKSLQPSQPLNGNGSQAIATEKPATKPAAKKPPANKAKTTAKKKPPAKAKPQPAAEEVSTAR
jgi:hypothetical protein